MACRLLQPTLHLVDIDNSPCLLCIVLDWGVCPAIGFEAHYFQDCNTFPSASHPSVGLSVLRVSVADSDILGGLSELDIGSSQQAAQKLAQTGLFDDPFGGQSAAVQSPQSAPLPVVVAADKGKGLTIRARLCQENGALGKHCTHLAPLEVC